VGEDVVEGGLDLGEEGGEVGSGEGGVEGDEAVGFQPDVGVVGVAVAEDGGAGVWEVGRVEDLDGFGEKFAEGFFVEVAVDAPAEGAEFGPREGAVEAGEGEFGVEVKGSEAAAGMGGSFVDEAVEEELVEGLGGGFGARGEVEGVEVAVGDVAIEIALEGDEVGVAVFGRAAGVGEAGVGADGVKEDGFAREGAGGDGDVDGPASVFEQLAVVILGDAFRFVFLLVKFEEEAVVVLVGRAEGEDAVDGIEAVAVGVEVGVADFEAERLFEERNENGRGGGSVARRAEAADFGEGCHGRFLIAAAWAGKPS
jgi:hypothetical protein